MTWAAEGDSHPQGPDGPAVQILLAFADGTLTGTPWLVAALEALDGQELWLPATGPAFTADIADESGAYWAAATLANLTITEGGDQIRPLPGMDVPEGAQA